MSPSFILSFLIICTQTVSILATDNEMTETILEAITHCSPVLIFEDENTLENFQIQTKNFRLISAQQPIKVNFAPALKSPETASKVTPVILVKRYKCNCETLFVLLSQRSNAFLETKNFQNYLFNVQKPKRDNIFFTTLHFNAPNNKIVPKWTTKLRFFYFLYFKEKLILENLIQKTSKIENNDLKHKPREYTSTAAVKKLLNGKVFKVTTLLLDPYITLKDGVPIGGCFYNMVLHGSQKFNFTFSIEVPAWAGASQFPNGTWRGPMREVIEGEKDFILGTGHTYERDPYLDYPCFFELTGISYATAHPKTVVDWRAILYIFEPSTWACLALTFLTISGVVLVALKMSSTAEFKTTYIFTTLSITFNPLLEQGATIPRIANVRLVYLFNMLMSLVIVTYFKSDFIAYVTYPSHERIPLDYRELGERAVFTVMLMQLNALETVFFNKTTNPLYVGLRERMIYERDWVKCMAAAAFDPKTVCISVENMVRAIWASNFTVSRIHSPVVFSKENAYYFIWGVGFTRHSKYVDSFASIIRLLRDTGNIRKWMDDHYEYKSTNSIRWLQGERGPLYGRIMEALKPQLGLGVVPFRLSNVLLSLIVWGFGVIIGGIAFFLENGMGVSRLLAKHILV
ncbi:unnamed protein product [Allacma fusca]|uniref:Uncharacterized protein n=1 Tax=Allacma fusca TaxID=39272 RepID=A0A8J2KBY3_9HEXA|nr:unnamed protein product [Allacma fusca]